MKVRLTNHMKYRLIERGISVAAIKAVLKNSNRDESAFGGKRRAQKSFGAKTLEVIYFQDRNAIVIVTAYYL